MSDAFVWFHNSSSRPAESTAFYEAILGWKPTEGPGGMTMFVGEKGPFASVKRSEDGTTAWLPYAQVDDVDAATAEAVRLGAEVVAPKTRGPAGEYVVVRDPGGAAIALWQKV